MVGELFINDKDAYITWGVNMGDGFLDAISAPISLKSGIENESRKEHGKRVITNPYLSSRELTLGFTITGANHADYKAKKNAFYQELYKGKVKIYVPSNGDEVYHLDYLGKNVSFAQNISRTFCKMVLKFEETNPNNRV